MSGEPPVRVGLRVEDVGAAASFYEGFGFVPVGTVPGRDGKVLMAILRRGPLQLLVDALVGMPFPDSARERQTLAGPRGLGMVIGIEVEDVDEMARSCRIAGCVIGLAHWMLRGASGTSRSRTHTGMPGSSFMCCPVCETTGCRRRLTLGLMLAMTSR